MKINHTSLNSSLEINKRQIQMSIATKTSKEDNNTNTGFIHLFL